MVVVADGTPLAAEKLDRVLTTDPAMGVLRHVDAGTRAPFRYRASAPFGCRCSQSLTGPSGVAGSAPLVGPVHLGMARAWYRSHTEVTLLPGRFAAVLIANPYMGPPWPGLSAP